MLKKIWAVIVLVALLASAVSAQDLILRGIGELDPEYEDVYQDAYGGDFQVLFPVTSSFSLGPSIGIMRWNTERWSKRFCYLNMTVVDRTVDSVPIGVAGRLDVSNLLPFGGSDGLAWYLTGNVSHHIVNSNAELEITTYGGGIATNIEVDNTTTAGVGLDLAIDLNPEGTCAALFGGGFTWDLQDQDISILGSNLPLEAGLEGWLFRAGLLIRTR